MRTHEIVGPEMTQITGQLRIPKDTAIANHIAQFWNNDKHWPLNAHLQPTEDKTEKCTKVNKNREQKEREGLTRTIVETTIVMSDAMQIKLEDVRDGIIDELESRRKKWMKEEGFLEPAPRTGKWNDI